MVVSYIVTISKELATSEFNGENPVMITFVSSVGKVSLSPSSQVVRSSQPALDNIVVFVHPPYIVAGSFYSSLECTGSSAKIRMGVNKILYFFELCTGIESTR